MTNMPYYKKDDMTKHCHKDYDVAVYVSQAKSLLVDHNFISTPQEKDKIHWFQLCN